MHLIIGFFILFVYNLVGCRDSYKFHKKRTISKDNQFFYKTTFVRAFTRWHRTLVEKRNSIHKVLLDELTEDYAIKFKS